MRHGASATAAAAIVTVACALPPAIPPIPPPAATPPAAPLTEFQRDYIEALFFGTGAFAPANGFTCVRRNGWLGFPRGTTVAVIVSTVVTADKQHAIRDAAAQVQHATAGAISATFALTDDPNPVPAAQQVTSTTMDDPGTLGCRPGRGCTMFSMAAPAILRSSRAVQLLAVPPNNYSHDVIGHGVLGLCHIDGTAIGGFDRSLMSDGRGRPGDLINIKLTDLDLAALRAVYGSALHPGASPDDFRRAGLIRGAPARPQP